MNSPDQPLAARPTVLVLAHSKPWCAALAKSFSNVQLTWALTIEDLLIEADRGEAIAAILEFPIANFPGANGNRTSQLLDQLTNHSHHVALFAVGDEIWIRSNPLLRALGFAASFYSLHQISALVQAVKRHSDSIPDKKRSIEQQVQTNLPWATAANPNQP